MEVLTELKDSDHTSPQYPGLIQQITANFDDFKDNGVIWGRGGAKAITRKDKDDQFIGYTFKRKKVRFLLCLLCLVFFCFLFLCFYYFSLFIIISLFIRIHICIFEYSNYKI
jgi:hypothetical protein